MPSDGHDAAATHTAGTIFAAAGSGDPAGGTAVPACCDEEMLPVPPEFAVHPVVAVGMDTSTRCQEEHLHTVDIASEVRQSFERDWLVRCYLAVDAGACIGHLMSSCVIHCEGDVVVDDDADVADDYGIASPPSSSFE